MRLDISSTEAGVQVVVDVVCPTAPDQCRPVVLPGDPEWPRLHAAGQQLRQDVSELAGTKLVRVDQRVRGYLTSKQFSFVRGQPS